MARLVSRSDIFRKWLVSDVVHGPEFAVELSTLMIDKNELTQILDSETIYSGKINFSNPEKSIANLYDAALASADKKGATFISLRDLRADTVKSRSKFFGIPKQSVQYCAKVLYYTLK